MLKVNQASLQISKTSDGRHAARHQPTVQIGISHFEGIVIERAERVSYTGQTYDRIAKC